jgi:hypothetical protein
MSLYNDFNLPIENTRLLDYAYIEAVKAPITIGYLASDTLFYALPELLKCKYDFMIHHIATLFLVIYTLYARDGSIMRFVPHLLICDTTNLLYNTAWIMKLFGFTSNPLIGFLEGFSALTLVFVRCIHMVR